ncbi:uncharacterized protein si:dkeyp-69c1.9 isoform X2 [Tachysurus fulvidraco]|uniref:uncharacterized protein si:dkeyp-69c1.9 isoform X2 n=1 Tax=Tachysurus fulvidraco TaxID=1234273 RepID=UPI000F4F6F4A|nr:uncharacterized protein si:dkeyp-69c1.9 isoform X2 [Tachysurus fulvidraco]
MTMQKRPLRKLCPLPPHGHDLRFGLMHLMNDQRIKPLQAFPQVGELPPVAGDQSYITTNQEAFPAQALHCDPLMMMRKSSVKRERTPHYQTHYQQSFVRPQYFYGRRLQALPRPDNLAINPGLRADFKTVQMQTYPGWDISLHSRPLPVIMKEQLSLKEQPLTAKILI